MIPRIEQKLEFNKRQYIDLLTWLKLKKLKVLYPNRIICSRYLDTISLKMYQDTIEGLVPRKKIRIRTYDSEFFENYKNIYNLEIKITAEFSRYKEIKKNVNCKSIINNGYYDKFYGICFAKVDISYEREYYAINNIRFTIDKNIKYKLVNESSFSIKKEIKEDNYVLELKTDINENLDYLRNEFPFPRTRFSKYEKAIESLYG